MQHAHPTRHGRPHLIKQQLAAAVLQGLACMSLAKPVTAGRERSAGNTAATGLAILAGALGNALAQFGETAHLLLSYPAELTEGRTTQGLNGRFEVDNGLATLLAGTDSKALRSTNGGYQIARRQHTDALQLDVLSISGKAPGSTPTEGSGSYTTLSSSSSTRLNLTPKETPQSLTVMTRQRLDDQRLTTLSDTMDATPGIIVLRDGLGAESDSFWSRGFEIQNFEIDGVPTTSAWTTTPRAWPSTTAWKWCEAPPA